MPKKVNDTQAMNIRLPIDLHKTLKGTAFWKGVSMNQIIVDAVYAELSRMNIAPRFTEAQGEND